MKFDHKDPAEGAYACQLSLSQQAYKSIYVTQSPTVPCMQSDLPGINLFRRTCLRHNISKALKLELETQNIYTTD